MLVRPIQTEKAYSAQAKRNYIFFDNMYQYYPIPTRQDLTDSV